jgi:hypothetical protein
MPRGCVIDGEVRVAIDPGEVRRWKQA